MDFSLFYFSADSTENQADRYRLLLEGARFADTHDFCAVWTPERHFHPFGGLYPDPALTGAAIAAVTKRVGIRAGSVVAPIHHPVRLAEQWAVVDNLSNGRVGVSFASGWSANDFAFTPQSYERRHELVFEYAQEVRRLWRGEELDVVDGAGNCTQVRIFPQPIQTELPTWISSAGDIDTFRGAGRIGANLLTHLLRQEIDELSKKIEAYRSEYRAATDGATGHVTLMVHTFLGEDDNEVREMVREPLSQYLRSSINLLVKPQHAGAPKDSPPPLLPADVDFLVERSFSRYFNECGLLGSVEKAQRVVERLRRLQIDELACLIDFGLPTPVVVNGLKYLNRLRQICKII